MVHSACRRVARLGTLVVVALAAQATGCQTCPTPYCPAEFLDVSLGVTSSQVSFTGASTGTMDCETSFGETACFWPASVPVVGSYELVVTAPGFETATVSAVMKVFPADGCGCAAAVLTPSDATLDPT
jgi:hypothetical protein